MWEFMFYLVLILCLAAVGIVGAMFLRGYLTGTAPGSGLFGPRPERRLDIVEQANVDGRRKLMLIRRDDVEHLIMTGGPVDVVIETGIGQGRATSGAGDGSSSAAVTTFTRQPRALGQAVNER